MPHLQQTGGAAGLRLLSLRGEALQVPPPARGPRLQGRLRGVGPQEAQAGEPAAGAAEDREDLKTTIEGVMI